MKLIAVTHSRKKFYKKTNICWYQLACHPSDVPMGFLNIPDTELYEYGGTNEEAVETLKQAGFKILKGTEI